MNLKSRYLFLSLLIIFVGNITFGQTSKMPQVNDTTYMLTYDHGGLILWGSDHNILITDLRSI